jgi:predicted transcriptional regulator
MKVKKFKIRIRAPGEPPGADLIRTMKLAEKGIFETDYDLVLTLPDMTDLAKIFSPQRVRLLQTVRTRHPQSIYQLAKMLERQLPNVQRDVRELAQFGILELKKLKKKESQRESVQPVFPWSGFDVAV